MPTTFRTYALDQELLLAPSLHERLPADHLAYFISGQVEELDLSAFYAPYEGDGRRKQPYEPRMLLKVLDLRLCHGHVFLAPDCGEAVQNRCRGNYGLKLTHVNALG